MLKKKLYKEFLCICIIITISFVLCYYATHKACVSKNINIYISGNEITEVDGTKISLDNDLTFIIYQYNNNELNVHKLIKIENEKAFIENGIINLNNKNLSYNILRIINKNIFCIDANCPDKICVLHGKLHLDIDNDMIVCAPHKLLIKNAVF